MITIRTMAAQGDVLFRRVNALPDGLREEPRAGPLVVAHSETGHHHVIRSPDTWLLRGADPFVCYLRLEGAFADVEHERPYHTHETVRLLADQGKPSYFEVRRQREHVPGADEQTDDDSWTTWMTCD